MAEAWVRFPLGALSFRTWGSLVSRVPWEHENAGSTPAVLTELMRWFPCWYGCAAVNRADAGSIPAAAALRKGKPSGDGTPLEPGRTFQLCLEGSTPSPSACTCPWPIGGGTRLPSWTGGFDSRRALWTHASFRGRRCWYVMRDSGTDAQRWSHEAAGSIPAPGADVRKSFDWMRNLSRKSAVLWPSGKGSTPTR